MAPPDHLRPGMPKLPPEASLLMMINSYRVSQIIHTFARLGIADVLAAGPRPTEEIARLCDAQTDALFRFLRAAAGLGLCEQDQPGRFCGTPLSDSLRAEMPFSLYSSALMIGAEWHWRLWGEILEVVRGGRPAFARLFGSEFREHMAQSAGDFEVFRSSIEGLLSIDLPSLFSLIDFDGCRTLLYPGFWGGYVGFLSTFLKLFPSKRAIVLDFAENVETAARDLARYGLLDRCEVVAGDPFMPFPSGADTHVLRELLCHHNDEDAARILRNSHLSLPDSGRLLIVGLIVPPGNEFGLGKLLDLEAMLVSGGSRERTQPEYEQLLSKAGFGRPRITRGMSPTSIIEARKA
jgi:SAM-dependent methyltransferase